MALASAHGELNDLYLEMSEGGVSDKTVLVFGQMNEPPGARSACWTLTALTFGEYSAMLKAKMFLLFIDNIFRFTQAGSEYRHYRDVCQAPEVISPRSLRKWVRLQERITSTKKALDHLREGNLRAADDLTRILRLRQHLRTWT